MNEQFTLTIGRDRIVQTRAYGAKARADQMSPIWATRAIERLSSREREVLVLLEARWTDREIADALCISYRTATTHVSNIFDKLGVNSRREAAAIAALIDDLIS
ncbi:MAG TPA: helix-turn-helix transcriptional regulator [Thermomicrobiales bacterium]|nr:helix-turn-helix transcriptional regulator [Thermomicrobiales bacterium]